MCPDTKDRENHGSLDLGSKDDFLRSAPRVSGELLIVASLIIRYSPPYKRRAWASQRRQASNFAIISTTPAARWVSAHPAAGRERPLGGSG